MTNVAANVSTQSMSQTMKYEQLYHRGCVLGVSEILPTTMFHI